MKGGRLTNFAKPTFKKFVLQVFEKFGLSETAKVKTRKKKMSSNS